MADTYPPNEVGDVPTPVNGSVQVPGTDTDPNGPGDTEGKHAEAHYRQDEGDDPAQRGSRFRRAANVLRDLVVGFTTRDQRLTNGGYMSTHIKIDMRYAIWDS